ncbi:hemin uptake protein HemP [Actimicrobium antarcticum]|uniref:Hemin uptake protein HemP n=1 Tax=Actimicrobium antarcticum TaxID=1051899 RepID=A0ABP7T2A0_9BURK
MDLQKTQSDQDAPVTATAQSLAPTRYQSNDLFQQEREIEIEHHGRIYRMRVTHLNKLILTA